MWTALNFEVRVDLLFYPQHRAPLIFHMTKESYVQRLHLVSGVWWEALKPEVETFEMYLVNVKSLDS